MKKQRHRSLELEMEINMTPMIDIVFQLLIFFVLTAKFIQLEGELLAYLPKDRGLEATPPSPTVNPLIVFLTWKGDPQTGVCRAVTTNYQPPEGGVKPQYTFGTIPGGSEDGWPPNKRVTYDYPDFSEIERYMDFRKNRAKGAGGRMPVTINFADGVPVQMVVNMLDLCQKLKITDFAINAQGFD